MGRISTVSIVCVLSFTLLFSCIPALNAINSSAWGGNIVINADGSITPDDAPIQRSGNLYVLTGDILSNSGTVLSVYRSNIILDGADYLIQGSTSYSNSGVFVEHANNVTIRNVHISNLYYGITICGSSQSTISACFISNCSVAVGCREDNSENKITGNIFTRNNRAIEPHFGSIVNSIISNNQITQNRYGIGMNEEGFYTNNEISGNNIANNNAGLYFVGYHSGAHENRILQNNITDNGEGILFLLSVERNVIQDNTITGSIDQAIDFAGGPSNNKILNNRIENNGAGILLNGVDGIGDESDCVSNEISGNNIKANLVYGLYLYGGSQNIIRANNITGNQDGISTDFFYDSETGLFTRYAKDNLIIENNITLNQRYGVQLLNATNNSFYHNRFESNGQQVYSVNSTNIWDNGYPSGGNHWSDYTGVDGNGDGIGDTLYLIDQNNQDRYPLVEGSSTVIFSDGFESGSFNNWSGTGSSSGETSSISATRDHHGSYSARFISNGGNGYERAYAYKNIAASSDVYARGYFYVSQSGIHDRNDRFFFLIINSGANGLAYAGWRQSSTGIRWCLTSRDGANYVDTYSSSIPSIGRWYCVELHWNKDAANGLVEMWVNGQLVCTTTNRNTAAFGDATQVRVGLAELYSCRSTTVYADCISIGNGYMGHESVR